MRHRARHKTTGKSRRAGQVTSGSRGFGRLRPGALSIALASLFLFAFALPATAQAGDDTAYSHLGEFGALGSASGEFANDPAPGRMAVHEQTGKVFIADTGNHRIQVFDPVEGDPPVAPAEELGDSTTTNTPIGVAVDQVTADLYVIAAGSTNAIVKFTPATSGVPADYTQDTTGFASPDQGTDPGEIGSFGETGIVGTLHRGGIAVDNSGGPGQGDILIADTGRDLIQRFDSSGVHISDFNGSESGDVDPFQDLFDLAVDSSGDILVVDHVSGEGIRVERFDSAGNWQATLPMPPDTHDIQGIAIGATVAVNRETDEVVVGYKPPGPTPAEGGDPWEIAQLILDESGDDQLVRTFGAPGDRFDWFIHGIGVRGDAVDGRLYAVALDSPHHAGGDGVPRVQVFEGVLIDPPTCEVDPPIGVTSDSATFTGRVNPGGGETVWTFRYRAVGESQWLQEPDPPESAGDGIEDVDVGPVTVSGLEPNTEYEVELWAKNDVDAVTCGDPETGDPRTFITDAVPPAVDELIAVPGSTMASFRAEVNPRNSETSWAIEYRLAGSVQWIELTSGNAGDGATPVGVIDRAYDLSPSTQYEVRVVAENEAGTEVEGEVVETGAAHPERAYELASPLPTGGVSVDNGSGLMGGRAASEDGDRALISTFAVPFPGMDKPYQRYVAERSADGWATRPVDEHPSGYFAAMSADGSHVLIEDRRRVFTGDYDPDDQNQALDLYLRGPDGDLIWISRDPRIPLGQPQTDDADMRINPGPRPSIMSADGRTVAFMSARNLLDADPHPSSSTTSNSRLYKWSDGELKLIGVLPGASDPPQPGDVPRSNWLLGQGNAWYPNAVSRDGSRVIWRAGGTIYVSVDGHDTIEIAAGAYRGAAADGSRVFYTSGGDLHAFDVDEALSGAADPVISITGDGGVLGVAGTADSGTHVYFVSDAVIVEAETGPAGTEPSQEGRNLYRAEILPDGSVDIRFVAGPLAGVGVPPGGGVAEPAAIWANSDWPLLQSFAAPDGGVLAFGSWAELIPGQSTGGFRQMYVYDDEDNTLACVSCMADGSDPLGVVNVEDVGSRSAQIDNAKPRWVAEDGTVFFQSYSQLLPQVTNEVTDAYAYRDGELTLISGGTGQQASTFHDASADGETVFFRTGDALVPADNEPGVIKLYAARVGGGIDSQQQLPPEPGVPCVGDECRDEFDEPESPASASTEEFSGAGDRPLAEQCASYGRQARIAGHRAMRLVRHTRVLRQMARRLASRGADPRRVVRVRRLSVRTARAARAHMVRARDARERLNACRGLAGEER